MKHFCKYQVLQTDINTDYSAGCSVTVSTPPQWTVQKMCYKIKKLFTHVESHVNAVSLLKSGE